MFVPADHPRSPFDGARLSEFLAPLWAHTLGSARVRVALLDGPVDVTHPCFLGAQVELARMEIPQAPTSGPAIQHGTHTASVLVGQPGTAVHGIAPACRLLVVPVFRDGADGMVVPSSQNELATAIRIAVDRGSQLINISGGQLIDDGAAVSARLADAVRHCERNNVLIVAAAGNDGCRCLHVPAALPSVLAVGAMSTDGRPLDFSNWGDAYAGQGVLALGENIVGAVPSGEVAMRTGTSFAAPIVTGVAALLMSLQIKKQDAPDARAVRRAILDSALGCDYGRVSDCRRLLVGRLNVTGAVASIQKGAVPLSETTALETSESAHSRSIRPQAVVAERAAALAPSECACQRGGRLEDAHNAKDGAPTRRVEDSGNNGNGDDDEAEGGAETQAARDLMAAPSGKSARTVEPSRCACKDGPPQLAYVLGQLWYDFGTEARRDSLEQACAVALGQ